MKTPLHHVSTIADFMIKATLALAAAGIVGALIAYGFGWDGTKALRLISGMTGALLCLAAAGFLRRK